jgi:hypothetical protein
MSGSLDTLTTIAGDEALAAFRGGLTGARAVDLLHEAGGRLLVQLSVGSGKTEWIPKIVVHALTVVDEYDCVILLVPRRDILGELVHRLPAGLPFLVLKPRPRRKCGALNKEWLQFEEQNCNFLGRMRLCNVCPKLSKCPWPGQYGRRLRGTRLILGTQHHLQLNPLFVKHLCHQVRANNPLVLIDESDLLIRSLERRICKPDLDQFRSVQEAVLAEAVGPNADAGRWRYLCSVVAEASTQDLRTGDWTFPWVDAGWATRIQQAGVQLFGCEFRFIGYDLQYLAYSDPASRERLPSGDLRYAIVPQLGNQFMIFSGSIARELARYRLDPNHARPDLLSPFAHLHFEHPNTRWYNIDTNDGAAQYFPGNAARILDFFAAKIARNIAEGKCTLLVSRKKFLRWCKNDLRARLNNMGAGPVKMVTGDWNCHDLRDPRTIALINYGVAGLNRFEHCDAAYCLNSYYITAETVSQVAQDIDPAADRFPITLGFSNTPPCRRATVILPDDRETNLPQIAQGVLEQKESDVVVQAVGRVRPFTRPREIITFQRGGLPGVWHIRPFRSLVEARLFFQILTPVAANLLSRKEIARRYRAQGLSLDAIANEMNVSRSTVQRYVRH